MTVYKVLSRDTHDTKSVITIFFYSDVLHTSWGKFFCSREFFFFIRKNHNVLFSKKNFNAKLIDVAKFLIRVFHYGVQNESFTMKGIITWN